MYYAINITQMFDIKIELSVSLEEEDFPTLVP